LVVSNWSIITTNSAQVHWVGDLLRHIGQVCLHLGH
jgi:hypothetical protein